MNHSTVGATSIGLPLSFRAALLTRSKQATLIAVALLGLYLNIVGFGFEYGRGNQEFELALVNWLKNPSLYPNDPITEGFARFPTFFWKAVAYGSLWADTQIVLFVIFIVTKILFFLALTRLIAGAVRDHRLVACIVCAVALSPLLNSGLPLSESDVLNSTQTHTSLAIALLLWAGCFLLEGRWVNAALLLGLTTYINGLFVFYASFAFAGFALIDWRHHKREILVSAVLLPIIVLPCLLISRGTVPTTFPNNYIDMVLLRYPFHYTLRSHSATELLRTSAILLTTACIIPLAAKLGLVRHYRLELLTGFFLFPFLLGAIVGELFPVPFLILLQSLRSESFLLLYSILLVQIYGARILLSINKKSQPTTWLVGVSAVLYALNGFVLLTLLITGILLALDPFATFDRFCRRIAQSCVFRTIAVAGILAAVIVEMRFLGGLSSPGIVAAFAIIVGTFWAYSEKPLTAVTVKRAVIVSALVLVAVTVGSVPTTARLWNPVISLSSSELAWRQVQQWAKASTPQDARFLTPPMPSGFRVFSERVSWVEWKDGNTFMTFPPYADEWLRRMSAVGIRLDAALENPQNMLNDYKKQSWVNLSTIAQAEKIDYIVQFREIRYSAPAVFANQRFAVYRVRN